ncbi:cell wall / vacuolar inhibitor of fructosidase 1-like [Prunus dulcis]|uniref:cell wall / vacuolar inhibitor of fructosidase 1-like n=1 Tax=Prunus dulcis TaxID=3755 RepID=UPI0014821FB6|nr:cell wall / vacuolar inhibitor of fructosidase 1-like [Prunus dulcis]
MKNSISPKLMLSLLEIAFCLIVFLPISHCKVSYFPMGANLIDLTCKKTPYYDLCVISLNSDPRSYTADVAGLGVVMADVVKAKATDSLNKINELLTQSPGDRSLTTCVDYYKTVIEGDVPLANEAFAAGNAKLADQGMSDAGIVIDLCESQFSEGSSPVTDKNKAAHDVAAVGAAIARTML